MSNEHNNAPAVPQGLGIGPIPAGATYYCTKCDDFSEPCGPDSCGSVPIQSLTPAAPAVPQNRIDKAKRAIKDLADEAQANGNSETWVSAQERLILSVIDAATPAPAPAQEVDEAQIQKLRENGAKDWAGVDAQQLRAGFAAPLQEPAVSDSHWDDNPDGVVPGQDSPVRMNTNTGSWDAPDVDQADRVAFENAAREYGLSTRVTSTTNDAYLDSDTRLAWAFWQSSIDALKPSQEPAQEVGLTDEDIYAALVATCEDGSAPTFDEFTNLKVAKDLRDFSGHIIAALRAKGAV